MEASATLQPAPHPKKMRVAMLTPLPPARTGIAHYASMILPPLSEVVDLEVFGSKEGYRPDDFDVTIHQLGNNPHHEWIYREAMAHPGVIVLHDIVLHHLIVEMTLARGDVDGYVAALRASHGDAGAAWARGRAAGLHSEMGNFLLPASTDLANRSHAVIVHNRWSRDRLLSLGVSAPIHVVPHPYDSAGPVVESRERIRARLGLAADARVLGLFGFLTSAKRSDVVLLAFARARAQNPDLQLLVVGEPAPNIDTESMRREGITFTGYAEEKDFAGFLATCDQLVNLRYPSAGETSGTMIRAFVAGKPLAVSDYAQFAELPDSCVVKIPLGAGETEALIRFFTEDLPDPSEAQRAWLESNATMERVMSGYLAALAETKSSRPSTSLREAKLPQERMSLPQKESRIALFPSIDARLDGAGIILRNRGDTVLRTRVYGQPGYRVIVHTNERGVDCDRWIELPSDLAPGAEVQIPVPQTASGRIRLHHALEGISLLDPEPFASLEIPVARSV